MFFSFKFLVTLFAINFQGDDYLTKTDTFLLHLPLLHVSLTLWL